MTQTANIKLPQHWDELSDKQLANISMALHYNQVLIENKHNTNQVNTATYISLAKELLRHNSYSAIKTALTELRPTAYLPYLNFILNQACNRFTFPKTLLNEFLPPEPQLKNVSIGHFSYLDAIFYRYTQTKTTAYLDRLCAALYLPNQQFSKAIATENTSLFTALPLKHKLAIFKTYEGCRNHMVSLFPHIFPKPKQPKSSEDKEPQKIKKQNYVPFGQLIAKKIDYDPSKLEQVERINAYKFLALYETELREIKKVPKK